MNPKSLFLFIQRSVTLSKPRHMIRNCKGGKEEDAADIIDDIEAINVIPDIESCI
jgi:hypothetical protein